MFNRKLKVVTLSLCILASTMGSVFAEASASKDLLLVPPDAPVYYDTGEINKEIYDKQVEIDIVLFKNHYNDLQEKGISITHTVPNNEYVEIGITPYNEENANFIYELIGKDKIQIIEGIMAITFEAEDTPLPMDGSATSYVSDTNIADLELDTEEVTTTVSVDATKETEKKNTLPYILGGGIVVLGVAFMFNRKKMS